MKKASIAPMMTKLEITPIAIPAFAPALRPGGVDVDGDVDDGPFETKLPGAGVSWASSREMKQMPKGKIVCPVGTTHLVHRNIQRAQI